MEELSGEFTTNIMISDYEAEILRHTSSNGRFVTDEKRVIELAERGLLYDHGPQRLAGGMHYLVMTGKGRTALNEWHSFMKAYGPKPPKVKVRRKSKQFRAWEDYCEANGRLGFSEFLKEVWPECKSWSQYA